MKCPKCNEEIDHRGIVYHFEAIHNGSYSEMIGILFDKIEKLEQEVRNLEFFVPGPLLDIKE